MLDHPLALKPGFIAIPLRNLQPAGGLVNVSCYIIRSMTNNALLQRALLVNCSDKRSVLPRIPCYPGDEDFLLLDSVEYVSFVSVSPHSR